MQCILATKRASIFASSDRYALAFRILTRFLAIEVTLFKLHASSMGLAPFDTKAKSINRNDRD